MLDGAPEDPLLARVTRECELPADLLRRLAALEAAIPDVNVWGAKAELGRRVAEILDEAAAREGAP